MLRRFGARFLMSIVSLVMLASMPLASVTPVAAQSSSGSSSGSCGGSNGWDQALIKCTPTETGTNQLFSDGIKLPGNELSKQDDTFDQFQSNSMVQGILATANLTENTERDQPEDGKNVFLSQVLANSYNKEGDSVELDFMQFMLVHHVVAVYMANSCVNKASHADLVALCKEIGISQAAQITQMNYYLASYYGVYQAITPLEQDEFILDRLSKVSGDNFDKLWLELMLSHHAQAVTTGKVCANGAEHGNVKELCQAIVYVQSAQIQQMADMLKNWYGKSMTTDPVKLANMIENEPLSDK